MLRAPERTSNVLPGATTAIATTRSVGSLAFGMSISLLPLPLSSSGRSLSANAIMWPTLVTATTRSLASPHTSAGCRTRALGVSDSMALPALLRLSRFSNRVTNP